MNEYIEREKLIDNLNKFAPEHYNALVNQLIMKQPVADVVEVKHGEWINEGEYLYKCSLCGDKAFLRLGGKPCRYCPNCGAKMKGGV